jgi:hypothetical protein
MNKPATPSICMVTPSYIGDIDQFSILRRSINLFAPGFPHLAIVQTEDCAKFRRRFRDEAHLEIIPTADVLPPAVELHRRKSGLKWFTGKWKHGRLLIKGWHAQQLAKIFALGECRYEEAVFLDSDVFRCRPLDPSYFYVDGRLKLFRRRAVDAEAIDFDISTHDILGNPLYEITQLWNYIFHPACFKRATALILLEEFRRRKRVTWVRRFLAQNRPSEYNLLGYAATEIEAGAGYHLIECDPADLHHSIRFPEDRAGLDEEIKQMRIEPKHFALIQSTLKLPYGQIVNVFDRVAEAQQAALPCSAEYNQDSTGAPAKGNPLERCSDTDMRRSKASASR